MITLTAPTPKQQARAPIERGSRTRQPGTRSPRRRAVAVARKQAKAVAASRHA